MKVNMFFQVESGFGRFDIPLVKVFSLEDCEARVEGEKLVITLSQEQSLQVARFEAGESVSVQVKRSVVVAQIEYDSHSLTNRKITLVPGGEGVNHKNVEGVIK